MKKEMYTMFKSIIVPVDLSHVDQLGKALDIAADLAKHYEARVFYVGVTATAPGDVAHSPGEFANALKTFANQQAEAHGIHTEAKALTTSDPTVEVDEKLIQAIEELNADLVVIGSHHPGVWQNVISHHGAYLATHADVSLFIVR
ncbi:MAG: universal stress protein [Gammaproteobacteria bacterium]|nr:universal stress protein [Gammaproteobacteria bacterium]